MNTVLRVLVIIILVLTAVSLYFANATFQKRQVLLGRNGSLEEQIVKVAKTIEAADPTDVPAIDLQKDISEVSDRELANPEKEALLENYPAKLETQNLPTLDYGNTEKRLQLRSFYVVDAQGNPVLSKLDNKPETKGPGSMQELLDVMLERAKAQQATLNKTRAELSKMREHLATSVTELNKQKGDGRTAKKETKEAKEQMVALQTEKETLEGRIAKLTAEKKEMAAEVADAKSEVEKLNEEVVTIKEQLASAQKLNKELKDRVRPSALASSGGMGVGNNAANLVSSLSAGDKGKIIESNDEFKFVVIEFSDDAISEMLGADRQNALPALDMNVRRTGRQSATGDFVTRIKLRQVVRGKNIVVADILSDWQQAPVEKGDVVFF